MDFNKKKTANVSSGPLCSACFQAQGLLTGGVCLLVDAGSKIPSPKLLLIDGVADRLGVYSPEVIIIQLKQKNVLESTATIRAF